MKAKYRIVVTKHGKALCTIDLECLTSDEPLSIVLERFPEDAGFEKEIYIAENERRLLESSRDGIKMLACMPEFELLEQR